MQILPFDTLMSCALVTGPKSMFASKVVKNAGYKLLLPVLNSTRPAALAH